MARLQRNVYPACRNLPACTEAGPSEDALDRVPFPRPEARAANALRPLLVCPGPDRVWLDCSAEGSDQDGRDQKPSRECPTCEDRASGLGHTFLHYEQEWPGC